ncbi:hypothetical protein HPB47_007569 [Ixodes persulcatus]|uniref:Uncharacterized protein n=1 Tax=Ixodes persulcatus TaxID=34615 RepID=A0AC60P747_IXOPE|nr:hypothetical protein HPB47_007569 [Ixodes persulcatus]
MATASAGCSSNVGSATPLDPSDQKTLLIAVKDNEVERFYESQSESVRCFERSYNFLVEGFVISSSVKANYARKSFKTFIVPTDAMSAPDTGDDAGAASGELSSTKDSDLLPVVGDVSFEDLVNVENGVTICRQRTDDDIVADVTGRAGDASEEDTAEDPIRSLKRV